MLNKRNKDLPERAGVYLFKKQEKILYVGKAKNLKNRINQYYQKQNSPILKNLLREATEVDFIITDNETDALHLEYNLIHQHQPLFNIRLKDDKSFPLIEITLHEKFPAIRFSRNPDSQSLSFGPITNVGRTKELIDMVTKIFKLRTCSKQIFAKSKVCLYYYIDRCSGPCENKISQKDYLASIKDTISFLNGRRHHVITKLRQKMAKLAEQLKFEEAQTVKYNIEMVEQFQLDSYISTKSKTDYDVLTLTCENDGSFIILFHVVRGKVKNREFHSLNPLHQQADEVLRSFLLSHYRQANLPDEILVSRYPKDKNHIEKVFTRIRGKKVTIKIPYRGNKKNILDLAKKNLNLYLYKNRYDLLGKRIQTELNLKNYPRHIEAFDISHFSERERVGAVVVFIQGQPQKRLYRNFLIKKALPGDTEAMQEIMIRRFSKYNQQPDLILVDGGKGQLGVALQLKNQFKLGSDLVALAKREERLFLEKGGSILFSKDSPERLLFQQIRDEAHRRAVTFHRKKREHLPKIKGGSKQ